MKKITSTTLLVLVGLIIIGIICIANEEQFYPEYRLQSKIDNLKEGEQNISLSEPIKESIRYKFYHDEKVDIAIELDHTGHITVRRDGWFSKNKAVKEYYFKVDKNNFTRLKNSFNSNWTSSKMTDADNHLGGTYYEMAMVDLKTGREGVTVGYYNVVPDDNFIELKNELIDLTKGAL